MVVGSRRNLVGVGDNLRAFFCGRNKLEYKDKERPNCISKKRHFNTGQMKLPKIISLVALYLL